jgi:hypothetical protein
VNPFEFKSKDNLDDESSGNPVLTRPRTQSSPADLEGLAFHDEFGEEDVSDEVFGASSLLTRTVVDEGKSLVTGEGTSKVKRLTKANTDGQILDQTNTVEDGKRVWAKEKVKSKAIQQLKKRSRAKTTS